MDLREIRQQVATLPQISKVVDNFSQNWVRPIRSNTNPNMPFLQNLPQETKRELNSHLTLAHQKVAQLRNSTQIHEKLHHYSRSMVDLTLSHMREDKTKTKIITNQMLNDDLFGLPKAIEEVKNFEQNVQVLSDLYHNVNELLHDHLSLEQAVAFMEMPHYRYLQTLQKTAQQQRFIVRDIGHHFVSVTKKDNKRAV
ncbi:hypothetical protein HYV86_02645 [Candidatus Woesearchaeota archaeon]|nr:hypothetical protein [Candidatus Woesearchaeota archaeon]